MRDEPRVNGDIDGRLMFSAEIGADGVAHYRLTGRYINLHQHPWHSIEGDQADVDLARSHPIRKPRQPGTRPQGGENRCGMA
ncbi:MAG: hypothetical protein N0E48_15760 [Candidatus Thiodiazotropha endolucinida]|nr:hypothetical protein [Candidatus Thiodiazotropha taylori]MCW4344787.1 hypothetical protein [Candidatus Thiodiazotropha endolucinida]